MHDLKIISVKLSKQDFRWWPSHLQKPFTMYNFRQKLIFHAFRATQLIISAQEQSMEQQLQDVQEKLYPFKRIIQYSATSPSPARDGCCYGRSENG